MAMANWGRAIPWFVAGAVVAGLAWLGIRQLDLSGPATLRSYEVRPEVAAEMRTALERALVVGNDARPLGRVVLSPDGRHLLVTAIPAVQKGVASIIEDVADEQPEPTPTIGVEAWLVVAEPGPSRRDAMLSEVEPALASIEKARGELRFRLVEKLATTARAGQEDSQVTGALAAMRVLPSVRKGKGDAPVVTAELGFHVQPGPDAKQPLDLKALVELPPGELLVIGQSSAGVDEAARGRQFYYIVRATL